MSLRDRSRRIAWFLGVIALVGQLLSPVVQTTAQTHLGDPSPRASFATLTSADVHERLRQLLHMTPAEIRLALTAHNLGTKKLCDLASSLAKATASALPPGFVTTRLLTVAAPLPRACGVPIRGHNVEGLHPLSTGPPA